MVMLTELRPGGVTTFYICIRELSKHKNDPSPDQPLPAFESQSKRAQFAHKSTQRQTKRRTGTQVCGHKHAYKNKGRKSKVNMETEVCVGV